MFQIPGFPELKLPTKVSECNTKALEPFNIKMALVNKGPNPTIHPRKATVLKVEVRDMET